jgi:hypothetical protein
LLTVARVTPANRDISAAVTWLGCGMGVLSVVVLLAAYLTQPEGV